MTAVREIDEGSPGTSSSGSKANAVDTVTEAAIMEALNRLMHGRTTFMIAHRLATLSSCDIRLEVKDGRVLRRDDLVGVTLDTPAAPPASPSVVRGGSPPASPPSSRLA